MIPYAGRTGTRRNLKALRDAGWRLMVSARGVLRTEGFPYALDNGAWTAFSDWIKSLQARDLIPEKWVPADLFAIPLEEWENNRLDVAAFEKAVAMLGAGADFVVVPDIVMGGLASLAYSRRWLKNLRRRKNLRGVVLVIAVQDGMEPRHVRRLIGPGVGLFIGGSTEWKLDTLPIWAALAHERGAICHVGRVNSEKRIRRCIAAGATSFDGTSASRFAVTLEPLDRACRQQDMFPQASTPRISRKQAA